ncbi:transcription elongation factor SPT6 homolog [Chenopodium quinoa]|uniref:transcription elongation factor SPT6 homolog n=1 Tax=Chenopodium quinoa TaxID=63459 RepID=UPI000B787DB3|nr:transcription elongation factor SPT6 homolog [Chenopodium quinoa]
MAGRAVVSDDEEELEVQDDEREQEEEGEELDDGEGGGGVDDDEDEDDEEGQDEFEDDGFIVEGDDEEEEPEEDEEERHKKKKKKKRESFELDDDDYELLLDNNVKVARKADSKKFKRLKKARRDTDAGHSGLSDEDDFYGSGRGGRMAEDHVKHTLFGDDDGGPAEDVPEEDDQLEADDVDLADEDDMADFIVSEDDMDADGVPVRRVNKNKKKKHRQAGGVPSSSLQEAQDIFGDVEELLDMRRKTLERDRYDESGEWNERRLEHEFEPIILAERYMTDKDDRIREIDIPERMQISEESTGPPSTDAESIVEEAKWIKKHLGSGQFPGLVNISFGEETEYHIQNFLNFTHIQKLDLPYIAMYRKEDIASLLKDPETGEDVNHDKPALKWHKVLWAVQDLDRKWLLLQKRKSALLGYYNKRFEEESRRIYDETRLRLNQQLFESIIGALRVAESEREVDDVDSKFNLHFPPGEAGVDEGQYRRPKRKSLYSICNKAGLWEVASKFGHSSEQFGAQISLDGVDEPEDPKETPEEVASNFTCAMFNSPQEVLKGARHMAAIEISCEPSVKKHFRSNYFDNAVVSTTPTPDGNVVIDAFHQFAGIKWLRNKPLNKFEDAQWLLIQKAEEEKLLQVTIKWPEEKLKKLIADLELLYTSLAVSKLAQLWNEQRRLILQDAIHNFILPALEKEARLLLTSRAKSWLLMDYGKCLWDKVSVAPYQRKESDISSDEEAAPRVMACCWGFGNSPTTFVMLDSLGEIVDVLKAGSISLRSQNVNDQQRKKHDQQSLLRFMTEHQPQVVVLGAVSLSCTRLKDDIYEIVFKMVEENPRDVGHEMDGLSVFYGDESLPRLYENSHISSDQIPGHPGIVRRGVALGRYLQNPLAMVANLCGPGREILSWKISALESFLNDDEKYGMVEQVMVDVTNQVGLDLNLAANHDWLIAPLQFISGLGPRKAASLQRSLGRAGAIVTRKDLLTAHGLGKKVFISASGFLRIRRSGLAVSTSQFVDVLDDTRIHPESYALAQEMAKDIYREIVGDDNLDDDDIEMAIENLRDRPSALKSFNVEAYAKDTDRLSKVETLHAIKLELIQGFQDWRKPYEEPSQDEEFNMISGETDSTLGEGRIVQATVRRVQPQRAMCVLDSGLSGMLTREDFSDDWRDCDLTEKLHEGEILTCKIKSILKNRYQVVLTCKDNDMRNTGPQNVESLDPYYHEDRSSLPTEKDKARRDKELAKKHFKSRMIVHPRFQNITADDAMELLADKDPGESVIRPSSRGPSYLTLTLKVYDGVFAHKDIIEGGKDHKGISSLLRIGKTLKIGEDTFEDLDEVMDRYVDPLVTHLKAMLNYRKFRKGTKAEVDELLRIEKSEFPSRIVYSFGISHEHPGTFILTYIRSSNPHHEYIGLYPKGFKFRKRMFDNIDRLVAYFQRHIDDPIHESPSIRSVAAMVPMRSPANGGSSGGGGWGGSGSNDGGWRGSSDREHSRTGRNDRNGGRDGHPSGAPRPYEGGGRGRGRGRGGRGSYHGNRDGGSRDGGDSSYGKWSSENKDSGHGSKWGSDNKEGNNGSWGSFPGAKVQNAPGEEAFPGGWGSSGGAGSSGGGWGDNGSGGGGGGGSSGWGGTGGDAGNDSGWGSGSKSNSKGRSDGGAGGW